MSRVINAHKRGRRNEEETKRKKLSMSLIPSIKLPNFKSPNPIQTQRLKVTNKKKNFALKMV